MPDPRDPTRAEREAEKQRQYREGISEYRAIHDLSDAHLTAQAITNCPLCDDDGYRNRRVCDHRDHSQAAARGSARIREILATKTKPGQP
jgi:hypothetical protein